MNEDLMDAVSIAMRKAWQLGQTYWWQADSESYRENAKSDETQAKFDALVDETRALLAATAPAIADTATNPEDVGLPPYPKGHVVGPCVCRSWPGGECLKCPVIPGSPAVIADTAPSAFQALKDALQADPEYAWSWHCNLAMPIMDSIRCTHVQANKAGADLMQYLFGIDIRKHPHWHHDEEVIADAAGASSDDVREELLHLFREAMSFGLVYGNEYPNDWNKLREEKAEQLVNRAIAKESGK